jgi:hypothetical protein
MDWIVSTLAPAGILAVLIGGCQSVDIGQLESDQALEVRIDANTRACIANKLRPIKFFIDITNRTQSTINVTGLTVELRAAPVGAPEVTVMRQQWTYRWPRLVLLGPEKKLSIPIVPERSSPGVAGEFPIEFLAKGDYAIVATVNDRHESEPYRLKILSPDLQPAPLRRT